MENFSCLLNIRFIDFLEYVGTFAFAISGIRLAAAKRFDWFGAYVVGFATAIGGGTIRDLLLGVTPFWMNTYSYLVWTAIALFAVIVFRRHLVKFNQTLFIFDAVGLSFFTIVGIQKSLECGYAFWVAIIMGILTGCAGGIMRDVLINEVPLIFKKEIYAMASLLGGVAFLVCLWLGLNSVVSETVGALVILAARILSVRSGFSLPVLKGESDNENHQKE